jgi:general secretion pathway protein N
MIRRVTMGLVTVSLASLALLLHGAAASTSSSEDALDGNLNGDLRLAAPPAVLSTPAEPVTTVRVVAPVAAPARAPSANPLWAIPLSQLSGTRERPIFSPSRRPPPAAVATEQVLVTPPPRKQTIEPPQLALVGTIASGDQGFGIFIDQSTKAALRLKVGEDHQGWKLLMIQGREVTMEKDQQAAVLSLPQPGGQSSGDIRLVPVSALTRR